MKTQFLDRVFNIVSIAVGGFAITVNSAFCGYVIIAVSTLAIFVQIFTVLKISDVVPNRHIVKSEKSENFVKISQNLFKGWYLLVKSTVFLPSLALAFLYLNVLGTGLPLQGFDAVFYSTEPLSYDKFANMVIFRSKIKNE